MEWMRTRYEKLKTETKRDRHPLRILPLRDRFQPGGEETETRGLVGELPRLGLAPPLVFVRQCGPFFPNVGSEFAPSLLKGIRGQPSNFLRPNANRTNDTFAERGKIWKILL